MMSSKGDKIRCLAPFYELRIARTIDRTITERSSLFHGILPVATSEDKITFYVTFVF